MPIWPSVYQRHGKYRQLYNYMHGSCCPDGHRVVSYGCIPSLIRGGTTVEQKSGPADRNPPLARIQAPSSVALNRTWWIPAHPELRYLHWPSHPLVLWDRHGQTAEIRAARLTIYPRLWNLPSPIRLFTVEELTCWQLYQGMCFTKM